MPKQKTVDLTQGVNFTGDDGVQRFYPPGINAMPADHADHWYIQAHVKKAPPPALGDEAFATALRKLADHKRSEWQDIEDQAAEAEAAWNERKGILEAQRDNPEGLAAAPVDQAADEARAATELDPELHPPVPYDARGADRPASDPNHPQTQGDPLGRMLQVHGVVPVGPASDPNGPEGHPLFEDDPRFQAVSDASDQPASDPEVPEPKLPRARPSRK